MTVVKRKSQIVLHSLLFSAFSVALMSSTVLAQSQDVTAVVPVPNNPAEVESVQQPVSEIELIDEFVSETVVIETGEPSDGAQNQSGVNLSSSENLSDGEDSEDGDPADDLETLDKIDMKIDGRIDNMKSILFTSWEIDTLLDAERSMGVARIPTEFELEQGLTSNQPEQEMVKPPPEQRDIRLGGIVYHGKKEWTIWLNGQRITPEALPEEIIDIQVFDEYIELKWYDNWTNQIFPIRMRPHQRFNIDTRLFLPG